MLANQTSAPHHLLHSFPSSIDIPSATIYTLDLMPPMPSLSQARMAPTPPPSASRGFKSFFSRTRVVLPEPVEMIGNAKPLSGLRTDARMASRRTENHPSEDLATGQRNCGVSSVAVATKGAREHQRTKRIIKFAPSNFPAIQKGEDGKWQPPSLSRGSLSTSALNLFQDDPLSLTPDETPLNAHRNALSSIFFSPKFGRSPGRESRNAHAETLVKVPPTEFPTTEIASMAEISPPVTPRRLSPPDTPQTPTQLRFSPGRGSLDVRQDERKSPPVSFSRTAQRPRASSTGTIKRATPRETLTSPLSREHYHLRLTASYIVRALTPVVKMGSSGPSDKTYKLREIATEKLLLLARMEKAWGGEWSRISSQIEVEETAGVSAKEARIRAGGLGEKTKERERGVWKDALRDGVLLCFLLHHLFPSNPPHIARVSTSEDGAARATNLTRFIEACRTLGLRQEDIFTPSDLLKGSEAGLGRASMTIIALVRLAGRSNAGVGRPHSSGSETGSRPSTPGILLPSPGPSRPSSPNRPSRMSTIAQGIPSPPPTSHPHTPSNPRRVSQERIAELRQSQDSSNNLISKLTLTAEKSAGYDKLPPLVISDSDLSTPTRLILSRPTSPISGSPPRATSPANHGTPLLVPRASLRPRANRVTIDPCIEDDLRHSRSRERTPSLISSTSRVTSSAYTRSSAAFSIATITGDDPTVIDLGDNENEDPMSTGIRSRRLSERTLHIARQKIMGTLVKSSEDLPLSLEEDEARGAALSRSLAALEGSPRDSASRHRSSPRRGQSIEVGRLDPDIGSVVEEEDESEHPTRESCPPPVRPATITRLTGSGKGRFYVLKRSNSPSSTLSSSGGGHAFPSAVEDDALEAEGSAFRQIKKERRQSEGPPSRLVLERSKLDRPTGARVNSMINLTLSSSSSGSSSILRGGSELSVDRSTLQILEFGEGDRVVRYQIGNCIGRGQFGSVYRSLNLGTGQMVAIKRIRLAGMKEAEVMDVMKEVDLLRSLSHPSIVKYEGMSRDEEYLNIVLEFVENGSLGQTLKAFGNFNEKLVASYVAKILEGLIYLHSQGVVHCDLKSANILSTKNGNVKLSDFGVSLNLRAMENIKQDTLAASRAGGQAKAISEVAGTPNWMAPEVISLNGASPASDIWSLGCTIIELLTGKPPYADVSNAMTEDEMPPLPEVSEELQDFLSRCFVKNPVNRPTATNLFRHAWVTQTLIPEIAINAQDSVPFMRRLSRADSSSLFNEADDATSHRTSFPDEGPRSRTTSNLSSNSHRPIRPPKSHVLIKTSFSKAILCRLCHLPIKKAGVLCQDCGLLSHVDCALHAPNQCDLQEQLSMFADFQKLHSSSADNVSHSEMPDGAAGHGWDRAKTPDISVAPTARMMDKRQRSISNVSRSLSPFQSSATSGRETNRSALTQANESSLSTIASQRASVINSTGSNQVAGRGKTPVSSSSTDLRSVGMQHRIKQRKSDCRLM